MERSLCASVTAAILMVGMASAEAADSYTYTITMDGDPIGTEVVTISEDGARTIVDVATQTHVQVLFFSFDYAHERREIWQDGRLMSVATKTDDDGDPHAYTLSRDGDGFVLQQNGAQSRVAAGSFPLSLWSKAVLDKPVLLSVIDAKPYAVTTADLGDGHYKIDGDIKREVWFADDGVLQKLTFERKGYDIEFLRN